MPHSRKLQSEEEDEEEETKGEDYLQEEKSSARRKAIITSRSGLDSYHVHATIELELVSAGMGHPHALCSFFLTVRSCAKSCAPTTHHG